MNEIVEQPIKITAKQKEIFDDVEGAVQQAIMVGDPMVAFKFGTDVISGIGIRGYALAKLLYRLNESWAIFTASGITDDLFTMAEVYMGIKPSTTQKYMRMWEAIFENDEIPEDVKSLLMGRSIKDTLLLTGAARDGTFDAEELKEVVMSGNLRDRIREKRGEVTSSSSAIKIFLAARDKGAIKEGALFAKRGDETEVVGMLYSDLDELGTKAVARIVGSSGILEAF